MIKQLDEMDKNIKLRSQSYGFKVAILVMAVWTLYESCLVFFTSAQNPNMIPCIVLMALTLVQYFSASILKRKMTAGDEEYKEPPKTLWVFIETITAVIAFVVSFIIVNGI